MLGHDFAHLAPCQRAQKQAQKITEDPPKAQVAALQGPMAAGINVACSAFTHAAASCGVYHCTALHFQVTDIVPFGCNLHMKLQFQIPGILMQAVYSALFNVQIVSMQMLLSIPPAHVKPLFLTNLTLWPIQVFLDQLKPNMCTLTAGGVQCSTAWIPTNPVDG